MPFDHASFLANLYLYKRQQPLSLVKYSENSAENPFIALLSFITKSHSDLNWGRKEMDSKAIDDMYKLVKPYEQPQFTIFKRDQIDDEFNDQNLYL